jgi:hypothetical protein
MKSRIFSGWNFGRLFRLLIGIAIAVASAIEKDFVLLLPALYFGLGAILNVGCFAGSCSTNFNRRTETPVKETGGN